MPTVTLYTRSACGLCDEVHEQLVVLQREHRFELRQVDIDLDPEFRERYTNDVPVVMIDGREACRHRLDIEAVLQFLRSGEGT